MGKTQAILVLELTFLLLITLASCSYSQLDDLSSEKVSHGVQSKACKQAYGFLPCTKSAMGNIFLIFVYGYLISRASKFLTEGSEVLLEINGHGVFGGLFLPLLCSLPGALVILACGVFGSKESAQSQASIGMGLLAGTSITLLTLVWGSCVFAGKRDLHNKNATESPNGNAISLTGSGIVIDRATSRPVWIMLMSIVPFILVLSLQVLLTSHTHLTVLITLIVSVCLFLSYCLYQIFQPWIQHRRLAYAVHKHLKGVTPWITETGEPDQEAIKKLFKSIDHNSDGYLSAQELKALAFGVNFIDIDSDIDNNAMKLLKHFDTSGDSLVDENEFVERMSKLIEQDMHFKLTPRVGHVVYVAQGLLKWLKRSTNHHDQDQDHQEPFWPGFKYTHLPAQQRKVLMGLADGSSEDSTRFTRPDLHLEPTPEVDQDHQETLLPPTTEIKNTHLPEEKRRPLMVDERVERSEDSTRHRFMAVLALLLGTAIAAAFAHPLANSVHSLSSATSIPSFFISFLILPFLCSSEIFPSLKLARMKRDKLASLIFYEIYREVTMSNILYLSSFLFIIYIRDLAWSFSFELIVVVVVCIVMGVFAGLRTTYPLWTCLVAYSLYALSLVLAYVLPIVIG